MNKTGLTISAVVGALVLILVIVSFEPKAPEVTTPEPVDTTEEMAEPTEPIVVEEKKEETKKPSTPSSTSPKPPTTTTTTTPPTTSTETTTPPPTTTTPPSETLPPPTQTTTTTPEEPADPTVALEVRVNPGYSQPDFNGSQKFVKIASFIAKNTSNAPVRLTTMEVTLGTTQDITNLRIPDVSNGEVKATPSTVNTFNSNGIIIQAGLEIIINVQADVLNDNVIPVTLKASGLPTHN